MEKRRSGLPILLLFFFFLVGMHFAPGMWDVEQKLQNRDAVMNNHVEIVVISLTLVAISAFSKRNDYFPFISGKRAYSS